MYYYSLKIGRIRIIPRFHYNLLTNHYYSRSVQNGFFEAFEGQGKGAGL
jgi:hypothetical protein